MAASDAGPYTALADNGLGPPATAAIVLVVDEAGGNIPAAVIETEPGELYLRIHKGMLIDLYPK